MMLVRRGLARLEKLARILAYVLPAAVLSGWAYTGFVRQFPPAGQTGATTVVMPILSMVAAALITAAGFAVAMSFVRYFAGYVGRLLETRIGQREALAHS